MTFFAVFEMPIKYDIRPPHGYKNDVRHSHNMWTPKSALYFRKRKSYEYCKDSLTWNFTENAARGGILIKPESNCHICWNLITVTFRWSVTKNAEINLSLPFVAPCNMAACWYSKDIGDIQCRLFGISTFNPIATNKLLIVLYYFKNIYI